MSYLTINLSNHYPTRNKKEKNRSNEALFSRRKVSASYEHFSVRAFRKIYFEEWESYEQNIFQPE